MQSRRIGPALRRAFDRGVHGFARTVYTIHPGARPGRHGVALVRDLAYRETGRRAHRLDVYRPTDPGTHPCILYVHGGAFSMLSKDTHRVMALALASRGYVVFNINYRLGPRHVYPAQLEDVSAALCWVLEHGVELGADLDRLALMGESAGANLVTAITYSATHSRPEPFARAVFDRAPSIRATLPIYGLHDLEDIERFWRDPDKARRMPWWIKRELVWAAAAYVGHPLEERARRSPLASPLKLLEEPAPPDARALPPFFVAVGTADPLLDDSRRLQRAVEARGGSCDLRVYAGEIHGFNAMVWRPAARAKWRAVYDFLARHLGGDPVETGEDDLPLEQTLS